MRAHSILLAGLLAGISATIMRRMVREARAVVVATLLDDPAKRWPQSGEVPGAGETSCYGYPCALVKLRSLQLPAATG